MRYNSEVALTTLGYAFLGGLLPSLVWLYFLLKEDARCPEPRRIIALAFIAGMCAVPLALPLEKYAQTLAGSAPPLLAWAAIEEMLKYTVAALFILWRPVVDETPDYVIYMITVALGFAAAENMLFLFAPLSAGQVATGALTDDMRFIGSTLLHVTASATVGFALAFSARKRSWVRIGAIVAGLILAIALHTAFNRLIMYSSGSSVSEAFFLVWIVVVMVLAAFEVLKYYRYRSLPPNIC